MLMLDGDAIEDGEEGEQRRFLEAHPEEKVFLEVLEAALSYSSYREPHQSTFVLSN